MTEAQTTWFFDTVETTALATAQLTASIIGVSGSVGVGGLLPVIIRQPKATSLCAAKVVAAPSTPA